MEAIFEGKIYDSVIVDDKGQVIIPFELRKTLNIKTGDKLIIFTEPGTNSIYLIPSNEFKKFLRYTSKVISKLKSKVSD